MYKESKTDIRELLDIKISTSEDVHKYLKKFKKKDNKWIYPIAINIPFDEEFLKNPEPKEFVKVMNQILTTCSKFFIEAKLKYKKNKEV